MRLSFSKAQSFLASALLSMVPALSASAAPDQAASMIESIDFIEDESREKTIEQIVQTTEWQPSTKSTLNLGPANSRFWLRVKIRNEEAPDRRLYLRLNTALIQHIHSYTPMPDGQLQELRQGFLEIPSNVNLFGDPKFVIPASGIRHQSVTHYVSLSSTSPMAFQLALAGETALFQDVRMTMTAFGIIFGILLMMPVYNLLVYTVAKDVNFLLFAAYSLALGCSVFAVEGLFSTFFPNCNLWLKERIIHFCSAAAYFMLLLLTRRLLQTKVSAPRLDRVLKGLSLLILLIPVAVLFGDRPVIIIFAQLLTIVAVLVCLATGFVCLRKTPVAKYFIIGFSLFLGGTVAYMMQLNGVIESNLLTAHAVHFGAVFEEAFLSFAVAMKINILHDQLKARSEDLEKANVTLSAEIEHGKRMSKELEVQRSIAIHSAKLRAVGELAGGIAHQINNPLAILRLKLENLRFMLERAPIIEPEHSEIVQQVEGSEQVIIRMAKIIMSLLRMSRSSADDMPTEVPLSQMMIEALEMCEQRFVANGVKVRVAPDLDRYVVNCKSLDISQVILNLLVNAYDAICETPEPWIVVEAREADGRVELLITDSGNGIPMDLQAKIMEPFFTTKPPGKGTGVGLSIAVDLVQRSNARLYIESNCPNTRFVVSFPKSIPNISSEPARA